MKKAEDILAEINKKFGSVVGFAASSKDTVIHVPRISGGSLRFDVEMYGGYPCAGISSIVGWESTGKSLLLYRTIGQAQKTCRHCFRFLPHCAVTDDCGAQEPLRVGLVATEQYVHDWGERQGVDNESLLLVTAETLEACVEISEALLNQDAIDVLCWDSLACAMTEHSQESHVADQSTFIVAAMYATFLKRINVALATRLRKKAVICINQWRDDITKNAGRKLGQTLIKRRPGGATQKFTDSVLIDMTYAKSSGNKDAVTPHFFIKKNKTAPPLKKGCFKVYFEGDRIDDEEKIYIKALLANNLLDRSGGKWHLEGVKTPLANRKEIWSFLMAHQDLYYIFREKIVKSRKLIPTEGCDIDDMNFDEDELSEEDQVGEDGEQYVYEEDEARW